MATRDASRSPRRAAEAPVPGFSLQGKKALVTGGSKGIGLETARLFVDLGAEVVICARGEQDLQTAKQSMSRPGQCQVLIADLSTEAGVAALVEKLPFQELDVLVNNAGMNIRKKAEDYAEASKAAMDQLTRNLAVEWARFGIRVNSVAPGPIQTPLVAKANPTYIDEFKNRIPMRRIGQVQEVARPIAFFASEASSFITGQTLYVDGGFLATSFNEVPGFWEEPAKE